MIPIWYGLALAVGKDSLMKWAQGTVALSVIAILNYGINYLLIRSLTHDTSNYNK